ncbi:Protein of unknown function (DUF3102) [Hoeflea phototrophica DFL-43]|uniref:DUF3102 domain-containing protein n=1 Tax=Hoeflea phototrophica (strain DSM 17068 / NCIMB 14078 / DFL-43) TaxID=411684 RepID=A9DFK3_HOEPD|nr:DUF3102 domain-containing protein [Hoeflea phototrophica]EDQ31783.1 Protein of unknown function (DUF3102) [Hoeflea phototrophica DFL-43]
MSELSYSNGMELKELDLTPSIEAPAEQRVELANNLLALPKKKRGTTQVHAFDYSGISAAVAKEAEATAWRIRNRLSAHTIAIGSELLIIKKKLEHGKFGKWLEFHFGWTERTAQNYMNSATAFGSTPQVIDLLPLSTIYKLAAKKTPDTLRQLVIDEITRGETPDPKQIEKRIAKIKTEARQKESSDENTHTANPVKSPEISKQDEVLASLDEALASLDKTSAIEVPANESRDEYDAPVPPVAQSHELRAKKVVDDLKEKFGIKFLPLRDAILETDYSALRKALQD